MLETYEHFGVEFALEFAAVFSGGMKLKSLSHALTLEDIYKGKQLKIPFQRSVSCSGCVNPSCERCHGEGTFLERTALELDVRKGVANGSKFWFPSEGDQNPGAPPGLVQVTVTELLHPRFQRCGANLWYRADIHLGRPGSIILIEHLDGRWLEVKIPQNEQLTSGM
jgi:DnaJ-class molecular chaperone